MALKFRLFFSYILFAIFILFLSIQLNEYLNESVERFTLFVIIVIEVIILSVIFTSIYAKSIINLSLKLESDNKKLDHTIKKQKDQLNRSLEVIDKYVIRSSTDKKGIITAVSKAFCKISGYTKDELLGKPHSIVRDPSMPKYIFQDLWETIESGKTWKGVIKNRTKEGKSYWVKAFIEPEFDDNSELIGYTAIRHNITSEVLLESQMKQNSAIISFADSGIGTMDFDGNFLCVNGIYTKLFGYTKEELIGKNCLDITAEEDIEKAKNILKEAVKNGLVSRVEKRCIDKFGNKVDVEISLNKLPDQKCFVVVVNSLEAKKRLEEINSSLTKRVDQEVKKNIKQLETIQSEQLKHAKLNSIGLIAAGIIHEINTPLTYIKGNMEILTEDLKNLVTSSDKELIKEDTENIFSGINRIENIINSMREISQISSEDKGIENIYSTLITALNVLHSTIKVTSKTYINKEEFVQGMQQDKYQFFATVQKQRLEQVWIVIINNAMDELVKIKEYEQRVFHISIYKENTNIVIKFKDNGGGIAKEILPNIFDPLISTKESGGLGIGLNVAKNIIREQGGKIEAYNEAKGAVFEIRLPLVNQEK